MLINNLFNNNLIRRGDVVKVDLTKTSLGTNQSGIRPCIVVANNRCTEHSKSIQIIPLTTKLKKEKLPTHIKIFKNEMNGLTEDSMALCEATDLISTLQILNYVGKISNETMMKIDRGVSVQLDLFDMKRVESTIKTLRTLEKFIITNYNKNIQDLEKLYIMQKNDLDNYCHIFNFNYSHLYISKLYINNNNEIKIKRNKVAM